MKFDFEETWKEVTRKYLLGQGILPTNDDELNEKLAKLQSTRGCHDQSTQPDEDTYYFALIDRLKGRK